MTVVSYSLPLLATGVFLYWFYNERKKYPPGPFTLPFIGCPSVFLNYYRQYEHALETCAKYGDTWTIDMPLGIRVISTVNPKNVEYILKTNFDNYIKGVYFRSRFADLLGHGIFNVDGNEWRAQRKIASHIFTVRSLREYMFPVFVSDAEALADMLDQSCVTATPVNIQDQFFRLTLDALCEIAYGKSAGALHVEGYGFWQAFDQAQTIITERFFSFSWALTKALDVGSERRLRKALNVLNKVGQKILTEKRETQQTGPHRDLLSWFMSMKNEDGEPFSDTQMNDLIINFMLAGRDTTAVLLTWTVFCLCRYPEVETKVLNEILTTLDYGHVTYEAVNGMPYTHAVLSEVLRLYPSVPRDSKMAVENDVWPDGTVVPAGTVIMYHMYVQGRQKRLWGPDALDFNPDRWLGREKPSAFVYPQFNAGPRTCLGQAMAFIEAKTVLSVLLPRFRFTLVEGQSAKPAITITLPVDGGLFVAVTPRGSSCSPTPVG